MMLWLLLLNVPEVKKKSDRAKEEYSVKNYEIGPCLYEHYNKNKINEIGCEYILFRIDVYFSEYLLALESDKNGHTDRDLLFEKKDKEH